MISIHTYYTYVQGHDTLINSHLSTPCFCAVHLLDELLPVCANDGLLIDLLLLHEGIAEMVFQHLVEVEWSFRGQGRRAGCGRVLFCHKTEKWEIPRKWLETSSGVFCTTEYACTPQNNTGVWKNFGVLNGGETTTVVSASF